MGHKERLLWIIVKAQDAPKEERQNYYNKEICRQLSLDFCLRILPLIDELIADGDIKIPGVNIRWGGSDGEARLILKLLEAATPTKKALARF